MLSDSDSSDGKVYAVEIGPNHQADLTEYGELSAGEFVPMWNPDMLPEKIVCAYLELAKKQWENSILEKYTSFTEERA
jgi:hypothetical protein